MKNLSTILFLLFLGPLSYSQKSITLDPSISLLNSPFNKIVTNEDGFTQKDLSNAKSMGTFFTSNAFLGTKTSHPLNFTTNNELPKVILYNFGDFGIGTDTAGISFLTKFEINGFSKLGLNAPSIKTKTFTGTTAGAQNQGTSFAHGLTASKILAIKVMVNLGLAGNVSENYTINSGFQIGVSFENTLIYVWNSPANSSLALNKPYTVFVTYEE